jgi:hypothetical protein
MKDRVTLDINLEIVNRARKAPIQMHGNFVQASKFNELNSVDLQLASCTARKEIKQTTSKAKKTMTSQASTCWKSTPSLFIWELR